MRWKPAIVLLATVLVVATAAVGVAVVSIAVPNLTGLTVPQLEFMWKIAVGIGMAAGLVLGWLVTHESAKALETHKSTLAAAQRIVDRDATLEDKNIELIVKGHVDLAVQQTLAAQKVANDKILAAHSKDLDLKYQRKLLELTNELQDKRAQRAALVPALSELIRTVQAVLSSCRSLTRVTSALTRSELQSRIASAVSTKAAMEDAKAAVLKVYHFLPDDFTKVMRTLDRVIYDILTEIRAVPDADDSDDSHRAKVDAEYAKMARKMKTLDRHLRKVGTFILMALEREIDPSRFYELRIVQERNVQARVLVRLSRGSQRNANTMAGTAPDHLSIPPVDISQLKIGQSRDA
jgi:hypothetical protein